MTRALHWWQAAVIYQIYPRSFQDSNGDGVGDLDGIAARLAYLAWLGVDAIWISPFYPSPMADFGYDVSDYCDVDPVFGTLADFDALLAAAHAHGLKVILDFVPNHSSDQHPWFLESRASKESQKRDWYLWRDNGPNGQAPNNWISDFGGPAWTFDETTGQNYAHAFLPQQPDLNWRNRAVRAAMAEVMHFWLRRGVDGFRIDVIWHLIKSETFADNPPNPAYGEHMGEMHRVLQRESTDQPEVHEVIAGFRRTADAYRDRVLLGEIYLPVERLVRYYDEGRGVHLPLNFHLIETDWDPHAIAGLIARYEAALPEHAWPNWVLGNHDRPRIATRLGVAGARLAAVLLLTLRGTPTLYYGDELGLADADIPPEAVRDPRELRQPGLGLGRDRVRAPMPWSKERNAGFSSAVPWLPLGGDAATRNVEVQREDPTSMLSLYRALLALRRAHGALVAGDIAIVHVTDQVLVYDRSDGPDHLRIALNFADTPQPLPEGLSTQRVVSTATEPVTAGDARLLGPLEGAIYVVGAG